MKHSYGRRGARRTIGIIVNHEYIEVLRRELKKS